MVLSKAYRSLDLAFIDCALGGESVNFKKFKEFLNKNS